MNPDELHQKIARRAYELYLQRGVSRGNDVTDWLQAERDITANYRGALFSVTEKFGEYLKEEYRQITEAHFKTIEAISSFFRYYLLVMSFPVTLIGLFTILSLRAEKSDELAKLLSHSGPFLVGILFVVSLTGVGMMIQSQDGCYPLR
jgi:hypothetical protein